MLDVLKHIVEYTSNAEFDIKGLAAEAATERAGG